MFNIFSPTCHLIVDIWFSSSCSSMPVKHEANATNKSKKKTYKKDEKKSDNHHPYIHDLNRYLHRHIYLTLINKLKSKYKTDYLSITFVAKDDERS